LTLDDDAIRQISETNPDINCELITTAAYGWLKKADLNEKTLVYCDPPY